jgi:hypothetical protein
MMKETVINSFMQAVMKVGNCWSMPKNLMYIESLLNKTFSERIK